MLKPALEPQRVRALNPYATRDELISELAALCNDCDASRPRAGRHPFPTAPAARTPSSVPQRVPVTTGSVRLDAGPDSPAPRNSADNRRCARPLWTYVPLG